MLVCAWFGVLLLIVFYRLERTNLWGVFSARKGMFAKNVDTSRHDCVYYSVHAESFRVVLEDLNSPDKLDAIGN